MIATVMGSVGRGAIMAGHYTGQGRRKWKHLPGGRGGSRQISAPPVYLDLTFEGRNEMVIIILYSNEKTHFSLTLSNVSH